MSRATDLTPDEILRTWMHALGIVDDAGRFVPRYFCAGPGPIHQSGQSRLCGRHDPPIPDADLQPYEAHP